MSGGRGRGNAELVVGGWEGGMDCRFSWGRGEGGGGGGGGDGFEKRSKTLWRRAYDAVEIFVFVVGICSDPYLRVASLASRQRSSRCELSNDSSTIENDADPTRTWCAVHVSMRLSMDP